MEIKEDMEPKKDSDYKLRKFCVKCASRRDNSKSFVTDSIAADAYRLYRFIKYDEEPPFP